MSDKDIDQLSGVETTGHEWDGIKELNNPLPRWWLYTFYACIVWAFAYTVFYPAWPLISSATSGVLGYSSRGDLEASMEAVRVSRAGMIGRIEATPVAEILKDDEMARFARSGGESLYKVYCSQCHGTGASGSVGYPNLNDDDWLWGGSIDQIAFSITHGIRSADEKSHMSDMIAFAGILSKEQITEVANYIGSLGSVAGAAPSDAGKELFATNCAGCHGADGRGMLEYGTPNLLDPIWLYGNTLPQIEAQIAAPKLGVMPAWGERLGDAAVKQLAVYVHGLGGGQ